MKIAWATALKGIGDAYGFTGGNYWGRRCLEMVGVEIAPDAKVAVHHCPPHAFRPIPGKFNVLWTAWEFTELPYWETERLGGADYVLVTARFLIPVFQRYVKVPVKWVQQGIDTDNFFPAKTGFRKRKPYRVLWVGAPNDRKGWQFILGAWRAFADQKDMELVIKTTLIDCNVKAGNIIVENRDMSTKELCKLYQSADLFAFPTMGEGFGFTLGEAMACGVPCLYTPCTALTDLATPDVAIPIKCSFGDNFKLFRPSSSESALVPAAEPDATDLALKIMLAKQNRSKMERMGRRAAAHIRKYFTWKQAGSRLRSVLEQICG